MPEILFEGRRASLEANETVLDALLRIEPSLPYSCRSGACQSCIMKASRGQVTPRSQLGLKESWVKEGYFLPCVCQPTEDLEVARVDNDQESIRCRIESVQRFCSDIVRIRLTAEKTFDYRAGQYVNLIRSDGLSRSYSLASLPDDEFLELHVSIQPEGQMSQWLASSDAVGETVILRGPSGDCYYQQGETAETLFLMGSGTGLAPLYGVARDALRQGFEGRILLYHAARSEDHLYLNEELTQLSNAQTRLDYLPFVEKAEGEFVRMIATSNHDWRRGRIYLCGGPSMVNSLRKKLYLLGADLKSIHSDAFVTKKPSSTAASP